MAPAPAPAAGERPRVARNHGPFPYITSEGCWKPLPNTLAVRDTSPRALVTLAASRDTFPIRSRGRGPSAEPSTVAVSPEHASLLELQTLHCPPPMDAAQLSALVRYQLDLELKEARGPKYRYRGDYEQEFESEGDGDGEGEEPAGPPVGQPVVDPLASPLWHKGLSPWQRLNTHYTLASVRRHAQLARPWEPRDQLDRALTAAYQHDRSLWSRCQDVCVQPETLGCPTWRVMRNTRVVPQEPRPPRGHPLRRAPSPDDGKAPPRISVHSVKLAISGNHMSQTNAGFSRKVDGTFYS